MNIHSMTNSSYEVGLKKDNVSFCKSWQQIENEIKKEINISKFDKDALLKGFNDSCFLHGIIANPAKVENVGIPALEKLAKKGSDIKIIVKRVIKDLFESEDTKKHDLYLREKYKDTLNKLG